MSSACANLDRETSQDVIKCLIQAYPTLLGSPNQVPPLFLIARDPKICVLMPWIATNHTWVIEQCIKTPPVFDLIQMYGERRRTNCTATTLRQFLEAYPHALTQRANDQYYNGHIIHKMLRLFADYHMCECEASLLTWVVERCPSSLLLETDSTGHTPLHMACFNLVRACSIQRIKPLGSFEFNFRESSSEICKYLIAKCTGAARTVSIRSGKLPIHLLQQECDHRVIREVVVCLLLEYPESVDIQFGIRAPPRSIPFIQSIKPHLDEEKELKQTVASLSNSTSSLTEAVSCTNDKLVRTSCTVFNLWCISFINTTEDKLRVISTQLKDMCNEGV